MFHEIFIKEFVPVFKLLSVNIKKFIYSMEFDLTGVEFSNKTVLDAGCGPGLYSVYFALEKKVRKIIALDSFEGNGNLASNYGFLKGIISKYKLKNKIQVIKGDICKKTKIKADSIDVIFLSNILHHIYAVKEDLRNIKSYPADVNNMMIELKRILKKNAVIIINEVMKYNILELLPKRFNRANIYWQTKQNANAWSFLFKQFGFRCKKIQYYVPYKLQFLKWVLSNPVFAYFTRSRYQLILQKI